MMGQARDSLKCSTNRAMLERIKLKMYDKFCVDRIHNYAAFSFVEPVVNIKGKLFVCLLHYMFSHVSLDLYGK